MTLNEAKRARDAYMAAPVNDAITQVEVMKALFALIEELAARIEALEAAAGAANDSAQNEGWL